MHPLPCLSLIAASECQAGNVCRLTQLVSAKPDSEPARLLHIPPAVHFPGQYREVLSCWIFLGARPHWTQRSRFPSHILLRTFRVCCSLVGWPHVAVCLAFLGQEAFALMQNHCSGVGHTVPCPLWTDVTWRESPNFWKLFIGPGCHARKDWD